MKKKPFTTTRWVVTVSPFLWAFIFGPIVAGAEEYFPIPGIVSNFLEENMPDWVALLIFGGLIGAAICFWWFRRSLERFEEFQNIFKVKHEDLFQIIRIEINRGLLEQKNPCLIAGCIALNSSPYPITIDEDIKGHFRFGSEDFSGEVILDTQEKDVRLAKYLHFSVKQKITKEEALQITDEAKKSNHITIGLGSLKIMAFAEDEKSGKKANFRVKLPQFIQFESKPRTWVAGLMSCQETWEEE